MFFLCCLQPKCLKFPQNTNRFAFFFFSFYNLHVLPEGEKNMFSTFEPVSPPSLMRPPPPPQGHLSEGYGKLCSIYLKLLITKMEFHIKVSWPGLHNPAPVSLVTRCLLSPTLSGFSAGIRNVAFLWDSRAHHRKMSRVVLEGSLPRRNIRVQKSSVTRAPLNSINN